MNFKHYRQINITGVCPRVILMMDIYDKNFCLPTPCLLFINSDKRLNSVYPMFGVKVSSTLLGVSCTIFLPKTIHCIFMLSIMNLDFTSSTTALEMYQLLHRTNFSLNRSIDISKRIARILVPCFNKYRIVEIFNCNSINVIKYGLSLKALPHHQPKLFFGIFFQDCS